MILQLKIEQQQQKPSIHMDIKREWQCRCGKC